MRFKEILNESFRHTSTFVFLSGFLIDIILLPNFDESIARIIGLTHIGVVAFCIYFREWVISRNTASDFEQKMFAAVSFLISFSSGSALSFIFVYAVRSAELAVSWPLLLLLLLCMFANEFISTHNFRFSLDVGVLIIAFLFYTIFNAPLMLGVQSDSIFLLSVLAASGVSLLYAHILRHASHTANHEAGRSYALALGIPLFIGMLYFLNMIPAVPLSLKEAGVYHTITRTEGGLFTGSKEYDTRIFAAYRRHIFHVQSSDNGVYFFSKIDTPATITAPISHTWEYYDTASSTWVEATKISFDIQGGRDDGYRAYSHKENIFDGLWRVTVKVGDNRVVGRETFYIVHGDEGVGLSREEL